MSENYTLFFILVFYYSNQGHSLLFLLFTLYYVVLFKLFTHLDQRYPLKKHVAPNQNHATFDFRQLSFANETTPNKQGGKGVSVGYGAGKERVHFQLGDAKEGTKSEGLTRRPPAKTTHRTTRPNPQQL